MNRLLVAIVVTLVAALLPGVAQTYTPPRPSGVLNFEVSNGACSSKSTNVPHGLVLINIHMTSSSPQDVYLAMAGSDPKNLLKHIQVGNTEQWSTSVMLPVGTFVLSSSLGGAKCTVTAQ